MSLLRLTFEEKPVGEIVLRPSVPMATAMLCQNCDCIWEASPPHTCPSCGSSEAWPLEKILNREVTAVVKEDM